MTFLRLLAMLWLFYVTARVLRSLRDSVGQAPGQKRGGQRPGQQPFGDYGPFGRFGPFGPFGPFGQQGQNVPPPGGQNPFSGQGQGFGGGAWYGPFGADPFGQQSQGARPNQGADDGGAAGQATGSARQKTPYEVLGVRPGAGRDEVRRAYQELVRQYHPDRLDGFGDDLRALAEARTKEITAAYNQLKRRG